MGPNVKKLFLRFVALESVPDGGGLANAVEFFADAQHRKKVLKQAEINMRAAIEAVKSAPDNPYGDDEEKIARAILQNIEQRRSP